MSKRVLIIFSTIGLFGLFFILWLKGILFLDPDFGWHLGMGRYILEHGIPAKDPFSYTMPSFPFIDHEWLTNVIIFKLYPLIKMAGLSAISAILVLSALLLSLPKGLNRWSIIPLLLTVTIIVTFAGVRPQIETWFFLAVLLKVALDKNLWSKWRFALPLLFIPWVNLHGGFASGIATLVIIVILKFCQEKRLALTDLAVLLASILATFLNPFGVRIWQEIWMQISDGSLRWSIEEWVPSFFRLDPPYLFYLAFSSLIIWRYRQKIGFPTAGLAFILSLAGISSQRHIPLWLIAILPATSLALQYFYQDLKNNPLSRHRFNLLYRICLMVVLISLVGWSFLTLHNYKNQYGSDQYPGQAVDFLKSHPVSGHIFAPYNWGGYLIWKMPEQQVFVDGRMPSWRWVSPDPKESNGAFKDYMKVLQEEKALPEIFAKYHITTVLWQAVKKKEGQTNVFEDWQSRLLEKLFGRKAVKPFLARLKAAGWQQIYQDNTVVIYQVR